MVAAIGRRLAVAAALLAAMGASRAIAAQATAAASPAAGRAAVTFDEAARRAAAAREKGSAESLRWYREAVRLQPAWDEGWWWIGALSYEAGHDADAARAFSRFVELKPAAGPGWALLGLSEFRRARYDAALRDLTHGLSLGTVGNAEIRSQVYYHVALLRIRAGQFELALEPLSALAREKVDDPRLVRPCGLALLRRALLPGAVPEGERELVESAGSASCAALALHDSAARRFEEVIARYPRTPGLHYGYGAYLLRRDESSSAAALEQFEKEIAVDPGAVYARLEIAYELIRDGQHARAVPYAEEAVRLAPALFAAHNALGRALLETGQAARGIAELEKAVELAPESQHARANLAAAYARSGRTADADRERDAVRRLQARHGTAPRSSLGREDSLPALEAKP